MFNRNENIFYIYYNDFQDPKRIRQTIMHEIGHIYSDRNSDTDEDETFATHFAGYSLCPTPLLIEMDLDDFDFDLIKNMFDISNQATDTAIGIKLRRIFVDAR